MCLKKEKIPDDKYTHLDDKTQDVMLVRGSKGDRMKRHLFIYLYNLWKVSEEEVNNLMELRSKQKRKWEEYTM